jgi:hypothetical protein
MERLQRIFSGVGGGAGGPHPDSPLMDSSEQVYISSLALLKMLKHGKSSNGPFSPSRIACCCGLPAFRFLQRIWFALDCFLLSSAAMCCSTASYRSYAFSLGHWNCGLVLFALTLPHLEQCTELPLPLVF